MIPIQTIRLDISSDADLMPVLAESVSDFAESLGLSAAEIRRVEGELSPFFERASENVVDSGLVLEFGLADGGFSFSAGDLDGNRFFSRKIPAA